MIEIKRYVSGLLSSNMYVISEAGHAIVIDPFEDTTPSEGLTVDCILLTHEHYDHISGVNIWKKARDAPVICSRLCAENIRDPRKNLAYYFNEFCELQTWVTLDAVPVHDPAYSCCADKVFDEEMSFAWLGHQWHLFALPGHSEGSIGIILDDEHFFSGDSFLENYETSFRIPGGSKKKWQVVSRPKLKEMPSGMHVHPGHFSDFIYHSGMLN